MNFIVEWAHGILDLEKTLLAGTPGQILCSVCIIIGLFFAFYSVSYLVTFLLITKSVERAVPKISILCSCGLLLIGKVLSAGCPSGYTISLYMFCGSLIRGFSLVMCCHVIGLMAFLFFQRKRTIIK